MELRKVQSQASEIKALYTKLKELGLHEKGMTLEQMRHIMDAVDESINETPFNEQEIEFALKESEREFASANICNSTMISSFENTDVLGNQSTQELSILEPLSSPSPEICVHKTTVVAEVHHPLDWTPKKTSPSKEEKKRMPGKHDPRTPTPDDDSGVILSSNASLFETTNL